MKKICFKGTFYTISFDAMSGRIKEKLSTEELQKYLELLQKCQLNPRKIYKEVKAFCASRQDIAEIVNLLTFAHIQNYQIFEAEKLIKETYIKYPDYLFARINYADQCVRKKNFKEVQKIFPSFELKEIEPNREVFHTSEFRGFMIMMTYYHLALKEKELAISYFQTAKEVDPHHPGVIHLEKKLFRKSLLKRLLTKLSLSFRH